MTWLLSFFLLTTVPSPAQIWTPKTLEWTEFSGRTMGTTYRVKFLGDPRDPRHSRVQSAAQNLLDELDQEMSTYLPDSELMIFNTAPTTEWVPVSRDLYEVLHEALYWSRATGGVFDVTVGELVNLWGFGPKPAALEVPPPAELARVMDNVGYHLLALRLLPRGLRKERPGVQLDLSAVAKGYAVDRLLDLLGEAGLDRCLVEIGGELKSAGLGPEGQDWTVGIQDPGGEGSLLRIRLPGKAVATSGNYRQFVRRGARKLSHLLDPRTGEPVQNSLLSATVVHESAMTADILATALMVFGAESALEFAAGRKLAVLLIEESEGRLRESATPPFQQLLLPDFPEDRHD